MLERILLMSSRPLWLQILRWSAPLLISSAAADGRPLSLRIWALTGQILRDSRKKCLQRLRPQGGGIPEHNALPGGGVLTLNPGTYMSRVWGLPPPPRMMVWSPFPPGGGGGAPHFLHMSRGICPDAPPGCEQVRLLSALGCPWGAPGAPRRKVMGRPLALRWRSLSCTPVLVERWRSRS